MKLTYTEKGHAYYLDGKRCKGVTSVAKIPADSYQLDAWKLRMVASGVTIDTNLRENIATHIDDKDMLEVLCEDAIEAAKGHLARDRGSQKHRVLELMLLGEDDRLITEQQQRDRDILARTLDRYKLTPYEGLVEQFVVWPEHLVCGRFDAILERPNYDLWMVDLKSAENAINYPHSTACQLALYARAPIISQHVHTPGPRQAVTDWRQIPEKLDRRYARVLLVDNESDVGTLHRIDIEHGWAGARKALEIVNWRKQLTGGKDMVAEEPEWEPQRSVVDKVADSYLIRIRQADTIDGLRDLWREATKYGYCTDDFQAAATKRSQELGAA